MLTTRARRLAGAVGARLAGSPDTEPEQAAIRVVLATAIATYLYANGAFHDAAGRVDARFDLWFTAGFVAGAWCLLGHVLVRPGPAVRRRLAGMAADVSATSYGLFATGALGSPMVMVYLWVTVGNGFRYGLGYLVASTALCAVGFGLVLSASPYWQQHLDLGMGLLVGFIGVSAYVAALLGRLRDATRRAEGASRAKTRFLAHMSHEIRTPLNALLGAVELLRGQPPGTRSTRFVGLIEGSARTLLELVDNILDLSALEEGKVAPAAEPFELRRLVDDTVRQLGPLADAKGLFLERSLGPGLPARPVGDPVRVRQILLNLLGNAIKFTDRGGVRLAVSGRPAGPAGTRLRFEVEDTGSGIPEALRPRVFESYVHAGPPAARPHEGAGLGTAICKELVTLLGGEIGFDTPAGGGTRFWFEVDVAPDDPAARAPDPAGPVVLLTAGAGRSRLEATLARLGLEVDRAATGEAARGRLLARAGAGLGGPAPVLVVDHQYLDVEPAALAAALRAEPDLAGVGLVLVGPRFQAEYRDFLLASGIDALVGYDAGDDAVAAALGTRGAGRPAVATRAPAPALDVLVAEDEPINRMVIQTFLEQAGHRVRMAEDGVAALEALLAHRPDLALVDLFMPGLDGIEVVEGYRRSRPDGPGLPFVVLTASASGETLRRLENLDVSGILVKPVTSERLVAAVEAAARGTRLPAATANG